MERQVGARRWPACGMHVNGGAVGRVVSVTRDRKGVRREVAQWRSSGDSGGKDRRLPAFVHAPGGKEQGGILCEARVHGGELAGARRGPSAEERYQMMRELDDVILECDLPESGLTRGDVGTVVLVHQRDEGYEVEFTALDGETVAVVTLAASQVRAVGRDEIAHARGLMRAA